MPTFREYTPELYVSFKENKTQRVIFNPDAEIRHGTFEGRTTTQVQVDQNGQKKWLSIASKRLWEQLKNFQSTTTVEITQTGSGTATTYKVVGVRK